MSPRGGARPGAGHPLPPGQSKRYRKTVYLLPETFYALEYLALPGEPMGHTIDRVIAAGSLYPAWQKTAEEPQPKLPHPLHYAPAGGVCPLCGQADIPF